MEKITVAKFGGSTIGAYGIGIAEIVKRVQHLAKDIKNGARVFCTSLRGCKQGKFCKLILLDIGSAENPTQNTILLA